MHTQIHSRRFNPAAVVLALCCGLLTTTGSLAQNATPGDGPAKAEIPPPPRPKNLDQPLDPVITIRKVGDTTHEEYRIGGKLYMIKVTPAVGKPFFLVDRNGRGTFSRSDGPGTPIAVPQWVIFEF
jgi:hypothetical protein